MGDGAPGSISAWSICVPAFRYSREPIFTHISLSMCDMGGGVLYGLYKLGLGIWNFLSKQWARYSPLAKYYAVLPLIMRFASPRKFERAIPHFRANSFHFWPVANKLSRFSRVSGVGWGACSFLQLHTKFAKRRKPQIKEVSLIWNRRYPLVLEVALFSPPRGRA